MNVVKCPWCAAELDLGSTGEDLSDTRYKLTWPGAARTSVTDLRVDDLVRHFQCPRL
jgi:hypothetical protein